MKRRGSRVQIRPSFWNRAQPLLLKENARGGAMRHLLFLNGNPKDVAVRNPVLLNENAKHQLPSVVDRKDCSGAAPSILDRNTASMQLRLTKSDDMFKKHGRRHRKYAHARVGRVGNHQHDDVYA